MASISYLASPILLRKPSIPSAIAKQSNSTLRSRGAASAVFPSSFSPLHSAGGRESRGLARVAAEVAADATSEAARRLYVGNIPRTVTNSELAEIFGEHGSLEKAEVMFDKYSGRSRRFGFVTMSTVEDANAVAEKLNDTEIGGRKIKVNITEKPLQIADLSFLQAEESKFVDSPYKVYVGNLAKTVTTDTLSDLFSEKGKVIGVKVSRLPGTSKSSSFGFVSFSSEDEVEAAISTFNNKFLEGQRIRVNKA